MPEKKRVVTVVGARPQFVKAAVVSSELGRRGADAPYEEILVHTGQHYDPQMSQVFFEDLDMREPDVNLNVGSSTPAKQLGAILEGLESVIREYRPDAVLAYGDTNSTLAAGVMSAQMNVPFIHVEAGERIYRRFEVPEESTRIICDNMAHLCLASTHRAATYLMREWFNPERVKFVGDPMYDLFLIGRNRLEQRPSDIVDRLGLTPGEFHLSTIHRAHNTSSKEMLVGLLEALDRASLPVVLPVHPRVQNLLQQWGWKPSGSLRLTEALGYFDFLALLLACKRVVTDSGGVSREAFFAEKPSILPIANTWWVEVLESGWTVTTGDDWNELARQLETLEPTQTAPTGVFGDGRSAKHTVDAISKFLSEPASDGLWHRYGRADDLPLPSPVRRSYGEYRGLLGGLKDSGTTIVHPVSLELASPVAMARVEQSEGVRAVYCLDPTSALYNVLADDSTNAVREILDLGHALGVLTDGSDPTATDANVSILEKWFDATVQVIDIRDAVQEPDAQWTPTSGGTVVVSPHWWGERPNSPFEQIMKAFDTKRSDTEAALAKSEAEFRVGWLRNPD